MKKLLLMSVLALSLGACVSEAEQAVDDAAVTAKVKTRLASYASINAVKINVDTQQGLVTLTGVVPSEAEKTQAGQLTRETEGVVKVDNKITVDPAALGTSTIKEKAQEATQDVGREAGEALSDAAILTKIKAQYIADGILGTDVDVSNGEVTLQGTVNNEAEKRQAEETARQVSGVKNVKNLLTVKQR